MHIKTKIQLVHIIRLLKMFSIILQEQFIYKLIMRQHYFINFNSDQFLLEYKLLQKNSRIMEEVYFKQLIALVILIMLY